MLIPGWLKIQRVSLFLFAIFGVLLLVHALGYLSSAYIFFAFGDARMGNFYSEMQEINTGLLYRALLAIVFSLLLFILQLGRHAAGRYTLCIAILVSLTSMTVSASALLQIAGNRQNYRMLDLSALDRFIELGTIRYRESTIVFDLGIAGYALFFLAALFMAIAVARNAFSVTEQLPVPEKKS